MQIIASAGGANGDSADHRATEVFKMDVFRSVLQSKGIAIVAALAGFYYWQRQLGVKKPLHDYGGRSRDNERRDQAPSGPSASNQGHAWGGSVSASAADPSCGIEGRHDATLLQQEQESIDSDGDPCSRIEPSIRAYILAIHYGMIVKRLPRLKLPSYQKFIELALTLRGFCLEEYPALRELRDARFAEPQIDRHPLYRCLIDYYIRQAESPSAYECVIGPKTESQGTDENDEMHHRQEVGSPLPVYVGLRFIDVGCGFGTDMRQLMVDGVDPYHVLGLDKEHGYFAAGIVLYSDNNESKTSPQREEASISSPKGIKSWADTETQFDMSKRCVYHDVRHIGALVPSARRRMSSSDDETDASDTSTWSIPEPLASWGLLDIRLRDFICPSHPLQGFEELNVPQEQTHNPGEGPRLMNTIHAYIDARTSSNIRSVTDVSTLIHHCQLEKELGRCPITTWQAKKLHLSLHPPDPSIYGSQQRLEKINLIRSPSLAIYSRGILEYLTLPEIHQYFHGIIRLLCGGLYDTWRVNWHRRRHGQDDETTHRTHPPRKAFFVTEGPLKIFFGTCLGTADCDYLTDGPLLAGHDVEFASGLSSASSKRPDCTDWANWPGYSLSTYKSTQRQERNRAARALANLRFATSEAGKALHIRRQRAKLEAKKQKLAEASRKLCEMTTDTNSQTGDEVSSNPTQDARSVENRRAIYPEFSEEKRQKLAHEHALGKMSQSSELRNMEVASTHSSAWESDPYSPTMAGPEGKQTHLGIDRNEGNSARYTVLKKAKQMTRLAPVDEEQENASALGEDQASEETGSDTTTSDSGSVYQISSEQYLITHRHCDADLRHLLTPTTLKRLLAEHGFEGISVQERATDIHAGDDLRSARTGKPLGLCQMDFYAFLNI